MKKVIFVILSAILIIGLLISGCAEPTPSPEPAPSPEPSPAPSPEPAPTPSGPKYGGTLRLIDYAMAPGPFGLPGEGFGPLAAYQQFCLETLIMEDLNAKLEPWLATSWEIASDRSSITFHLRKGVKFHDDTDFTADAVKLTFELMMKSGRYATWTSVDIIDDYTVRLNVSDWQNKLLVDVTGARIVSPTAYEKNGEDWMRWNMVGTGPFKQVTLEKDVKAEYERFDNYWQEGKPYLDRVIISVVPDPMTQVAAMKNDEADALFGSMADQNFATLQDSGFNLALQPAGVLILIPDSANPDSPFAKLKVREAVEYAIDKEAIADALSFGLWGPAYQVIHPGISSFNPDIPGRKYDVAKAKQLLTEAGYPDGFETTIVTYAMDQVMKNIATAAQGYMEEAGIKTSLELPEGAMYGAEYTNGTWENKLVHEAMARFAGNYMGTFNYYLNPDSMFFASLARSQAYIDQFNKTIATTELDPANVQELSKLIYDEAMVIPTAINVLVYAYADYVKDADWMNQGTSYGMWRPDNAWLDK